VSSAPRVRTLLRSMRNLPAAASVGWRHVGRDRMHATLVTLRALPTSVRQRVADIVSGRAPSAFGAIALAADGRRDESLTVIDRAAASATRRRLRGLIATAAALDASDEADLLLHRLDDDDPSRPRLEALVAAQAGELIRAERTARGAGWRAARLRRRLTGELAALRTHAAVDARPSATPLPVRPGCILHLVTNALPEVTAGYTVRTQGIAAAQRRDGLDSHVATRLGFPVTAGRLGAGPIVQVDGVPYHRILPFRWLPATADRSLALDVDLTARLVERLRPTVLHAHSKHLNADVALALRDRYRVPVVYEVRGFLEETWRSRGHDAGTDTYRLAREAETRCIAAADAVVTIADSMKAEIVGRGIDPDRVVVVPNAVDAFFLAEPPGSGPTRRRLGFAADDVVVGLVTTVNDYEGVDTLVDALAHLRGRGVQTRLLVVGDGPALAGVRLRAVKRGLSDDAVFTGRVPFADVRAYYAAIDIFCIPRTDTPVTRLVTPLKPLEAMATGRPVVASDLPPLREIVDPGHTGVLAAPGDAASLADAIEPLVADVADRARMGEAARRWVAEHRTWDAAARAYRDLYGRLSPDPPVDVVDLGAW
jgi:glycosyltransferase involved in cell wall biosynthesis